MKSENESKVESGCSEKEEPPRKEAGFEWGAEPTEVIILFPTIWWMWMAGVGTLIAIVSAIYWGCLGGETWDYFAWSTIATLIIGLIIFLPEYFSNIINFAVNLCCWIAFSIFTLVNAFRWSINGKKWVKNNKARMTPEEEAIVNRMIAAGIGCSATAFLLSIVVVLLMSRMTFYYYKNR
ncbi:unnamed protein product [Caenorhabditis brenneri]